jgi:pyruvate-ferredoxin/flavodoxin oxidoreductase
MEKAKLSEEALLKAIQDQLQYKFGSKGQRVVDDNMRVVRRGFDEVHEITNKVLGAGQTTKVSGTAEPSIPITLKDLPKSESQLSDIHRFWEQTGNFYLRGMGNDNITDPFIGLSVMPAVSSLFRDTTGIRFDHPEWVLNNCTARGDCYTICPDTAISGLVSDLSDVLETLVKRVRTNYGKLEFYRK